MTALKELKGRMVTEVLLSDDKVWLLFKCSNGEEFAYSAEGDCCSNSWIEHINGLQVLQGRWINDVVERKMPDIPDAPDSPGRDYENDCIQAYGWSLQTSAGSCDIEMRNASNGYYGGWLQYHQKLPNPVDQYRTALRGMVPELKPVLEDF